jgi:hypothetical protein
MEKRLEDPTKGRYRMLLNFYFFSKYLNKDNNVLLVTLIEKDPKDIAHYCFLTIDDNLNVRMFRDLNGSPEDGFHFVNNDILAIVYSKKDGKEFHEMRLYPEAQNTPIIIEEKAENHALASVMQVGDEIYYLPYGGKAFRKFNLKSRKLSKDGINHRPLSGNDGLHVLKIKQ